MKRILLIIILLPFFTMYSKSQNLDSTFIYSVPNAFTPNSDGLNDVFGPYVDNVNCYSFRIFDRNNTIVYNGDNYWDGTHQGKKSPQGIYIWELTIIDLWGRKHIFYGHLILL